MLNDSYQTITRPSEGMFKDKGSRFLSFAYPVKNEDEIKLILAKIRKEHFSARHCCFAWSLGIGNNSFRVNDDGEPSGTAGRPIYGQIQSHRLTNILLVVVRYFGGTLLGVSGLIQAYRKAADNAISNAQVVTKSVEHLMEVHFEFLATNDLMSLIKEEQLEIIDSRLDLECLIRFKIRLAKLEKIEAKIDGIDGIISRQIVQD